jgi:DNA-binding HxlR family transcriptional regulator
VIGSPICPKFHKAIELVGSRWTGAVLQVLMAGPARFSTLRSAVGDISDRMLSERLRELEREAIVSRTVLPDPPVRVEYALTEKGHELQATLAAVARWAERWVTVEAPLATSASRGSNAPSGSRRPATAKTRGRESGRSGGQLASVARGGPTAPRRSRA